MRLLISTALTTLVAGSAVASEAAIGIDIPRLTVVEYHKPYVAFWLENADGSKVAQGIGRISSRGVRAI
jgi:hypothetical protein